MLTAAAVLFAANGYSNVTVDDIGASLGISGPALYHHFRSKEALLSELLISVNEGLVRDAERCTVADPRATLGNLIAALVAFSLARPELIEIHKREVVHAPIEVQQQIRLLKGRYVEHWVGPLEVLGAADHLTARAAAQAVISLIISTPLSRGVGDDEMATLLGEMAQGALGAFLGDPLVLAETADR